jgi:hypothetical protein
VVEVVTNFGRRLTNFGLGSTNFGLGLTIFGHEPPILVSFSAAEAAAATFSSAGLDFANVAT